MITITDRQQEFDLTMSSAWIGHREFANWLVTRMQPGVIVDLGIHYGFSTFAFAEQRTGEVFGIDSFEGDSDAGVFDDAARESIYNGVMEFKELHQLNHVHIIKGYFNDVAKTWTRSIDILHIDGHHSFESVKNDYETWSSFLKENGVVLFHDTVAHRGVKDFFNSITLPKLNFEHSAGLGVVTQNQELLSAINDKWNLS